MRKLALMLIMSLFCVSTVLFAEGSQEKKQTLVFGDLTWNSVQVHNRIAAFIIENGLGNYKAEFTSADTAITINGIMQGDINIDMESWHSNFRDLYDRGVASGQLVDLGKNMPDAPQGWWIPRYLVEGENAPAPGLKSVDDLPKYWELFKDPEDSSKGLIYLGITGWLSTDVSDEIFESHNLGTHFNKGIPGSSAALAATMVGNFEKRQGWIGYYWAPTAVLGKLDMVRLKGSEFEPADVNILVDKDLPERAPDVVAFLKKYNTTVADNNEFLAQMESHEWDAEQTALWFLKNKESVWTDWVTPEVAAKVKSALPE